MAVVTFHMINDDAGSKTLKTRPGDVFTLGAYAWPKVGNTGGGTIKLVLHCTSTVASPPAPTDVIAYTGTVPATGAWVYITGTGIIPAGYDTVDPQITLTSVPVTDNIYFDDILVRETTAAQNVLDQLYNSVTGGSGTANPLASLGTAFNNWISTLFGTTSVQSTIATAAVPGLSASKITSGTFAQTMVTGLSAFYNALTGAGTAGSAMPDFQTIIDNLNKAVTGSATTGQALSTWLTNLQSWMTNLWGATTLGTTLTGGAIPNLSASKITSGTFAQSMVTGLTTFITALATAGGSGGATPLIQDLQTMVDNLNTATGGSGTGKAIATWLTNLQSWMTNLWGGTTLGTTLTGGAIPNLSATKITSGNLLAAVLPLLIPSANIPALGGMYSPNLVLDPDFEATTLWTGATGVQSAAQAHSGTKSWQLTGAG